MTVVPLSAGADDGDAQQIVNEVFGPPEIVIVVNDDKSMHERTELVLDSLTRIEKDFERVYRRADGLARLLRGRDGDLRIDILERDSTRGVVDRHARWFRLDMRGNARPVAPPMEIVNDVLSVGDWPDLPVLDAIATTPVLGSDGSVCAAVGYHPSARVYVDPVVDVPPVAEFPTGADIESARNLLAHELFGEFPFADDAGLANTLAFTITPFVRSMIKGPTPLSVIEAPDVGSGKGLLASAMTIPAHGTVNPTGPPKEGEEWRKKLFAMLCAGEPCIWIDNVTATIDDPALAAILTSVDYQDRILGQTKMVRVKNTASPWIVTANNPTMSIEIARRSVPVRLDAGVEHPWLRSGWRHPDLERWALAHRGELVWACLTLCRAWFAAGRPRSRGRALGSFEEWCYTLGGILEVADIPDFLANTTAFYEIAAPQAGSWRSFIEGWWAEFATRGVTVTDLRPLAGRVEGLIEHRDNESERGWSTRLGTALRSHRDHVFTVGPEGARESLRLISDGTRQGSTLWRLATEVEE